jgi:hypothetical protein
VIVVGNLVWRLSSDASLPKNLPWAGVGCKGGRLARLSANLRSLFNMKTLLDEGYKKVELPDPFGQAR